MRSYGDDCLNLSDTKLTSDEELTLGITIVLILPSFATILISSVIYSIKAKGCTSVYVLSYFKSDLPESTELILTAISCLGSMFS
jgi:hypothetical protein